MNLNKIDADETFHGYDNVLSMTPHNTNGTIYCDVLSDGMRGLECAIIVEYTKTSSQENAT